MPSFLQPSKSWKWGLPLVLFGALAVFGKVMNTNPPSNSAQTSPQNEDLQPRVYNIAFDDAASKVATLSLSTYGRGWKLKQQMRVSDDEIRLLFHVPVVLFTDILTVSLKRRDDGKTEVNVESHSQIGSGDFGENRRHVQQMLASLDKTLS